MDIINELSKEANYKLLDALVTANEELTDKHKITDLICDGNVYKELFMLMNATARRVFAEERKNNEAKEDK